MNAAFCETGGNFLGIFSWGLIVLSLSNGFEKESQGIWSRKSVEYGCSFVFKIVVFSFFINKPKKMMQVLNNASVLIVFQVIFESHIL